ncbi:MAG TPA: NADH-quinone oxidoreductase subunit A [Nitrospirota bacterium]|nr:NADH-quinone oxidoreductase subunit A [Nitrospirota bacterium]
MTPGSYVPTEYLPIIVLMAIAFLFGAVTLLVGGLFRLRRPYREKLLPYASGNEPGEAPRVRFSIKYYIIAMLFVVFDVEAVFLYSWATVFNGLGLYALIEMILFIVMLALGFVYAWKKQAFVWDDQLSNPGRAASRRTEGAQHSCREAAWRDEQNAGRTSAGKI